jgi:NADH-quinone oxidoreductase subunit N
LACGLLSIVVGSLGAINQTKLKRLVAYSAIAHVGFMLIGLGIGTLDGFFSSFVYMLLYMIMGLCTFTILLNNGYLYVTEFAGLSRRSPVLALTFSLVLLSIAGIPPLAGFYSKYLVLLAAVDAQVYLLATLAIVASVIGAFYYVRIVK